MKKITMKTGAKLLAITMAMTAILTGCTSKPATTPTSAGSDSAGSTVAGGAAADVQKIVDAGKLKVGCKIDVPGFGFQNTSTKEYEGLEIDLAYHIAAKIFSVTPEEAKTKKLVEFQGVTAKTRGPLLDSGELDLVIATYTITQERKETWNFSSPYYTDAVGLMVLKDSGIASIKDLDGKIIGVSQGSTTADGFKAYTEKEGINVKPTFEEFDGYPTLSNALAAKNIDVFAVDRAILAGYNNDSTIILEDRFAEQEYGVASNLKCKGVAEVVEGVVTDLVSSGKMAEMLKGWGIE